jgi:hypothetical protein
MQVEFLSLSVGMALTMLTSDNSTQTGAPKERAHNHCNTHTQHSTGEWTGKLRPRPGRYKENRKDYASKLPKGRR